MGPKRKAPESSRPGAVAERLVPGGVSQRVSGQSKSEVVPAVNLSYKGKGLIINEKDCFRMAVWAMIGGAKRRKRPIPYNRLINNFKK